MQGVEHDAADFAHDQFQAVLAEAFVDHPVVFDAQINQHHLPARADGAAQSLHGQRAVGQAGQRVVQRVMRQLLFAQGDTALHRVDRLGQKAQFILALEFDRHLIIAASDSLGGLGQQADRARHRTRQPQGAEQRQQQRAEGYPQKLAI